MMDAFQRYALPAQRDGVRRELTDAERLSHAIDDTETVRATALRTMSAQIDLLQDAAHAVTHDAPHVAAEYLDRAITALTAGRDKIRGA